MGKGGGGGNQNSTTTVNPPGFAVPALQAGGEAALDLFNQGPQSFFPGQTFANFDPFQLAAQQFQTGLFPSAFQQSQATGQALQGSLDRPNLNFDPTTFNALDQPSTQAQLDAIETRANRNLLENILPNVRRSATGAGQTFGSTRSDVNQALQIGDTAQRIAEAQAGLLGTAQGQGLQAGLAARGQDVDALGRSLALFPQIQAASLFPGQILGDVGGQRQALAQQGISEDVQRFNFNQQAQPNLVNQLINQAGGIAGFGGTTLADFDSRNSNPLLGALGGGLLAGGLASSPLVTGFGPLAALGVGGGLPLIAGGALLGGLFG